nr:MAG TPA: hypothetical protein [Caudoviricetes sp.]
MSFRTTSYIFSLKRRFKKTQNSSSMSFILTSQKFI